MFLAARLATRPIDQFQRVTPMLRQLLFSIRRAAPLVLLFCISDAWAISVTPSPSYNGSYTVSWSTYPLGCWVEDFYPYYPEHCYSLQENGVDIAWSGTSKPISGKPPGSYTYRIYHRLTVAGSPWDEYTVEGPVTQQVLVPPPAFTISDASPFYVNETGQFAFSVTPTGYVSGTYQVNFSTLDSTALAGVHYTANSGTLTFN